MKNPIISLSLLIFLASHVQAQRNCGSEINFDEIQRHSPKRYQRIMESENFISNTRENSKLRILDPNGTIIIPVVVHVLHRGEQVGVGNNISVAQIISQINILNQDFRRLNPDRINTPAIFRGVAGDANIEFRLACIDPVGNATNGITRTLTPNNNFTYVPDGDGGVDELATQIKFTSEGGMDSWATDRYLNIWVCSLNNDLLGYAQFPFDYSARPNTDGVVITNDAFGNIGVLQQRFNQGRTASHEIGHWLNLYHIWGDAACGNDFCNDTPVQSTSNIRCPVFPHVSCGNNPDGDMFMNYMDYTDDNCMNMFSEDQQERMRTVFMEGGARASFIDNYFSINNPPTTLCNNSTTTISVDNPACLLPVTWTVSGFATIVSGQGTNQVTIRGTNTRQSGFFDITASTANYTDTKTIWKGRPATPSFLLGPTEAQTGAIVNYIGGEAQGAVSYSWRLPYPFETVSGFNIFGPNWQMNPTLGRSLHAFTGYAKKEGYVQIMGVNTCGSGGVKLLYVKHGSIGGAIPRIGNSSCNSCPLKILSPVPATDKLDIQFLSRETGKRIEREFFQEEREYLIHDLFGSYISSTMSNQTRLTIDLKNITRNGMYLLTIKHGSMGIEREAFIIDK